MGWSYYEWKMKEFRKFTPKEYDRYMRELEKTAAAYFVGWFLVSVVVALTIPNPNKIIAIVAAAVGLMLMLSWSAARSALENRHFLKYERI